ncbi:AMP-dependent synthetase and ligase [Calothrix sp. NIES-4071]|nr:AMP-dependent synthetase and ligase [Calothrix sp. NIES-4071]BAZ57030.1 AMP-dependent synthetase and ligase [Calothrix sp. NIES-4105]
MNDTRHEISTYASVVAVPAYPPRPNQNLSRLEAIVRDAQATYVFTTAKMLDSIKSCSGDLKINQVNKKIIADTQNQPELVLKI